MLADRHRHSHLQYSIKMFWLCLKNSLNFFSLFHLLQKETQELPLSDDSLMSQESTSSVFLSTSELEELVTPTVAPATPSYDADLSFTAVNHASNSESCSQPSEYMVSSVILVPPSNPSQIQSSQGSQNVRTSTFSEGVVATKEPEEFSSVLDSV